MKKIYFLSPQQRSNIFRKLDEVLGFQVYGVFSSLYFLSKFSQISQILDRPQ